MDIVAETSALNHGEELENTGRPSTDSAKDLTEEQKQEENKFQQAIASWRGIDLTNLISKLDTTASDIVAHQRDSLVQRKDLAQKTKDFRRLDDAGKLGEYKGLLKAYQTFIDLLTNDGKAASSAFLQVYSSLSEAPDPYPLLEASVDSLLVSEDTIPKLTSEKDHLQRSLNSLTNQLEQTEKRLEEERAARKELEQNRDKEVKDIETAWSAALKEKTDNWEAKEKSLEEKVENQDRLLKELKASYEVSQRLGQGDSENNDASASRATAAELEIVSADLEKTSLRLADVEARNEQLRLDLAQAASQARSDRSAQTLEENPEYQRLQSENSSLLRKIENARFDKDSEKKALESRLKQIERANAKSASERDELRSKLDKFADYDDIKQELEVIKSIEFSTGDDDDAVDAAEEEPANGDASKSKKDSLEQLLLSRNKKLGNELTILRVSHQDLQRQLEGLKSELTKTNAELDKSQKLSSTLENDLLTVQSEASNAFPSSAMSVAGTYTSRYPQSSRRLGGATSPTSSIISGFNPRESSARTMEAIRAGEAVGGGSGILPMVQAQRDRFKQKNAQLEDELAKTYNSVSSLRQEVASLQKDNLNLYEKTRYVSTYNRGSSSSAFNSNRPSSTIIPIAEDDEPTSSGLSLNRYKSAYEANISPFAAFRGRESARAYRRMTLPERIVFSITRLVMATRTSRNLFAAYCAALHLLVFFMLYYVGTVDLAGSASNLSGVGSVAGSGGVAAVVGGGAGGAHDPGLDSTHGEWRQEGFHEAGR